MKVTKKQLSDTRVEIKVVLDAADLKTARKQAIARLAKDAKVPGFRAGKAPAEVAEKSLDPRAIADNTLDIAVRTTVPGAFHEASSQPLVVPEVNVTKYVPDEMIEYTATADILPDVKIGKFKGLKAKKPAVKVTAKDIDEIITNIQKQYAEKKVVKRKAKLGDEVIIDFVGKKDDKPFDGGSAKDHHLELGSGQFIPGFEDGIVGHEVGDKFDLPLTFPKDYPIKDLAGAKVVFEILVKQVNEIILPKLDDAFAKKCGPFKTMDDLKADIKKNLTAQNEHRATEQYKEALVQELVKNSKVSAPEILVNDQLRVIKDDVTRNAASRGASFEDFIKQTGNTVEEWEKEARKIAEERVKGSLVLQILARDQKITAPDEEVDAKVAELRDVYQKSPEALKNLKDPNVRTDIKNRLTIEKTLDFLVDNNK
ncbi:trigger factor [Candidatus Saccharibacteria bacterium]|nr:trigger factor [Candidatus Saccharibacteria bacterium]